MIDESYSVDQDSRAALTMESRAWRRYLLFTAICVSILATSAISCLRIESRSAIGESSSGAVADKDDEADYARSMAGQIGAVALQLWVDQVLLATDKYPSVYLDEIIVDYELLDEKAGLRIRPQNRLGRCAGYTPEEIAFWVAHGPQAIPLLIGHVRDQRKTPWVFYYPSSSGVGSDCAMVGELACYLIEAILRENIYFTRTGQLSSAGSYAGSSSDIRQQALREAAMEYEEWYERCFDEASLSVVCSSDDLPRVQWDYDLSAGPRYLELRSQGR